KNDPVHAVVAAAQQILIESAQPIRHGRQVTDTPSPVSNCPAGATFSQLRLRKSVGTLLLLGGTLGPVSASRGKRPPLPPGLADTPGCHGRAPFGTTPGSHRPFGARSGLTICFLIPVVHFGCWHEAAVAQTSTVGREAPSSKAGTKAFDLNHQL